MSNTGHRKDIVPECVGGMFNPLERDHIVTAISSFGSYDEYFLTRITI